MAEAQTYVVPESDDAFKTLAMMNGGCNQWNNPFMYFIWLYMMRWFNNGNQDNLASQILDNHNTDLIMQGIQGNTDAIRTASERMGVGFNQLLQAVCGVSNGIASLGAQLGYTSERVINAVNQGDCGIIQALKDSACGTQKLVIDLGYQNLLANE